MCSRLCPHKKPGTAVRLRKKTACWVGDGECEDFGVWDDFWLREGQASACPDELRARHASGSRFPLSSTDYKKQKVGR